MPQKASHLITSPNGERPLSDFRVGEAGVITKATAGSYAKIGDPAIVAKAAERKDGAAIKSGGLALLPNMDGKELDGLRTTAELERYHARPLLPGERIAYEGV